MESIKQIFPFLFVFLYLILCYHYRNILLDGNECKMTFSGHNKDKLPVNVTSTILGPKLYKYISKSKNNRKSANSLNPHPVLFIPGHLGNVDQVRSFSSETHNGDGYFQYFSIEFNKKINSIALHGNNIIQQAIYINDAISSIRDLYKSKLSLKKEYNDTEVVIPEVTVIAHSLAAIVIRLAMILHNHPKDCPINNILALGSPISRSPYVPDASLNEVFEITNQVWYDSLHNSSTCLRKDHSIYFQKCSKCTPKVRLVSITGGLLDNQVYPELTLVNNLFPNPRNMTSDRLKQQQKIKSSTFQPIRFVYNQLDSLYKSIASMISGSTSSLENSKSQQCDSYNSCIERDVGEKLLYYDGYDTFREITDEDWEENIDKFIEPSYVSIRTSSLLNVEFPIDHKALLWCSQSLSVLSNSLKQLIRLKSHNLKVPKWSNIFHLSDIAILEDINFQGIISPVEHILNRKRYANTWKESISIERSYISSRIPVSPKIVQQMISIGIEFINQHLWRIYIMMIIVSILVLVSSSMHSIAYDQSQIAETYPIRYLFKQLLPDSLFNWKILKAVTKGIFDIHLSLIALLSLFTTTCLIHIFYEIFAKKTTWSDIQEYYLHVLFWILAFTIATIVRFFLAILFYYVRMLFHFVWTIVDYFWRIIIYTKKTRKVIRKFVKRVKKTISWSILLPMSLMISLAILVGVVALFSSHRYPYIRQLIPILFSSNLPSDTSLAMPFAMFIVSTFILISYVTVTVLLSILMVISFIDLENSNNIKNATDLFNVAILYFITIIPLGFPTFQFIVDLFFISKNLKFESFFVIFLPGMINLLLANLCICFHISYLIYNRCFISHELKPLRWMKSLLRNEIVESILAEVVEGAEDIPKCFHEDGGRHAIFVKCDHQFKCSILADDVVLGPTYRVVSCGCALDKSLKHMSEWCEYCLCRNCGGKNLPKIYDRNDVFNFSNIFSADSRQGNIELCQIVCYMLIAIYCILVVRDKFFMLVHMMAGLACISIARNILDFRYLGL